MGRDGEIAPSTEQQGHPAVSAGTLAGHHSMVFGTFVKNSTWLQPAQINVCIRKRPI
jgi:hypothetical protein